MKQVPLAGLRHGVGENGSELSRRVHEATATPAEVLDALERFFF